jgi:hypothetical protein
MERGALSPLRAFRGEHQTKLLKFDTKMAKPRVESGLGARLAKSREGEA